MSIKSVINTKTNLPTLNILGSNLSDRWYLDFLCKRNLHYKLPSLFGSFSLQGEGTTCILLSGGICSSPFYKNRVHFETGTPFVDKLGIGSGMAFLAIGTKYGVAPKAQLISYDLLDYKGKLDFSQVDFSIQHIIQHHTPERTIILNSIIQTPTRNNLVIMDSLGRSFQPLIDAGYTIVSPAGDGLYDSTLNYNLGPITADIVYPSCLPDIISVGALTHDVKVAPYSNYGNSVDIFAPGVDIPIIDKNGYFVFGSGTHLAAALVTGILLLYLEKYPKATRTDLFDYLYYHSKNQEQLSEPYPLTSLKHDPFFNEENNLLTLKWVNYVPYHYLVDTKTKLRIAQTMFTRSILTEETTSLGSTLSNVYFEIDTKTKWSNLYGEEKITRYTLLNFTPTTEGVLKIGEYSGIVFGMIPNIKQTTLFSLEVKVEDGVNLIYKTFYLTVLPNLYEDSGTIGGTLQTKLSDVQVLNVDQPRKNELNILSSLKPMTNTIISIDRRILLYVRSSSQLMGDMDTVCGEFRFTVPNKHYQAIIIDSTNKIETIVLEGLRG